MEMTHFRQEGREATNGKHGDKNGIVNKKPEKFKFKVRNNTYDWDKQFITGREVCITAGLVPPETYKLTEKLKGNEYRDIDNLDESIDLSDPGIEKFDYIPRNQTEG